MGRPPENSGWPGTVWQATQSPARARYSPLVIVLVVALALGRRLIRLQCYGGLDEARALYEWEYGKQLLYTQILRDKINTFFAGVDDLREAVEQIRTSPGDVP